MGSPSVKKGEMVGTIARSRRPDTGMVEAEEAMIDARPLREAFVAGLKRMWARAEPGARQ
jgi:hypothetical protein